MTVKDVACAGNSSAINHSESDPDNYRLAMEFVRGASSRHVLWHFGGFAAASFRRVLGPEPRFEERVKLDLDMGGIFPWYSVKPIRETLEGVDERNWTDGGEDYLEWSCKQGRLTERRRAGQTMKFRVTTVEELRTFLAICRKTKLAADPEAYGRARDIADGKLYGMPRQPLALMAEVSPVQTLIQRITGVDGFYYLLADDSQLMAETIAAMQELQRQRYDMLAQFDGDLYYQAENTSTTMISPKYYERYSLAHIREFAERAHGRKKRAMVHMCGLLKGLLPLIRQTGMDGIHSLTPPPVGDVSLGDAYEVFPPDFSILHRFNTVHWLHKSMEDILRELQRVAPQNLIAKHPVILWITGDSVADIPPENFHNLKAALLEFRRDCAQ